MLKPLFFRFWWLLAIASALSTLSALFGLKMLSIISGMIEGMKSDHFEPAYSFLTFSLIVVGVMLFGVISQYILLKLSSNAVYEVQKTLLERILATTYQRIEKNGSHKIMAAMKDDVSAISQGITLLPQLTSSAITVALCLIYMVYSSWKLFLIVVLALSLIVAVVKLILRVSLVHQVALRNDSDKFFSNLKALHNGGKEIYLNRLRMRNFYQSVMLPLFDSIRIKTVKSSVLFIALDSFTNTTVIFLIGVIVYASVYYFPGVDAQVVVAFILIILYMIDPLSNVVDAFDVINRVRASLKKINGLELADAKEFSLQENVSVNTQSQWKNLQLKNVGFTYQEESGEDVRPFVLGPISAEFKSGEITFITGGNGSGKSTFSKLLTGLYESESGAILVDGMKVGVGAEITPDQYRKAMSVVFADFFVFSQILNNQGEAAEDRIISGHLDRLKLNEKVNVKNGFLSTISLSTGQYKRLAMLQSRIDDAPVCIYDEWAADQDPSFKRYFYNELLPELKAKGKIVIAITHDDQYFHTADQVLKLENGVLVECKVNVHKQ